MGGAWQIPQGSIDVLCLYLQRLEMEEPSEMPTSSSSLDDPDMRILLLGRQSSGKSSSGNTVLGQKLFKVAKYNQKHEENICEKTILIGGRRVQVIDTPDLMDPNLYEEKLKSKKEELLSVCREGLSAVLLVVPLNRSVENEEEVLGFLKCLLDPGVQNYFMVLFTYKDELDDNETIDEYLQNQDNAELQQLVTKCGGNYHCFNNKCKVDDQVPELLNKIERMVTENNGKFVMQQIKRNHSKSDPPCFSEQSPADEDLFEDLISERKKLLRLVLLGKTGVGKSAAGNTIIGRNVFKSSSSSNSQTKLCSLKSAVRCDKEITVIDTPGLYDNDLSEEEFLSEIVKCMIYSSPGPHVFLIVITVGRFTEEEKKTVEHLKTVFGEDLEKYAMILFTYKDDLQKENKTIQEFLQDCDPDLKNLISRCGDRYFCLDNNSASYPQVKELLSKIEMMVERNAGTHFTNDMFKKTQECIYDTAKQDFKEKVGLLKQEGKVLNFTKLKKILSRLAEECWNRAQELMITQMIMILIAFCLKKTSMTTGECLQAAANLAIFAVEKLSKLKKKICVIQ